jgi:Protein of unknown function (DUF3027)
VARAPKKAAAVVAGTDALEPVARQALGEITHPSNVGALRDVVVADDVATVRFSTTQGGYPGWYWTVSIAVNPGLEPSVLETELMPAEGALVAPDWVPWADRLEDYLAQQVADAELAGDVDDDELDDDDDFDDEVDGGHLADDEANALDDDDELDDDDDDDDDDDHHLDGHADEHDLHGDDVDGVDIDLHLDDEPLAQ